MSHCEPFDALVTILRINFFNTFENLSFEHNLFKQNVVRMIICHSCRWPDTHRVEGIIKL
jgi:hypothetical protein